MNWILVLFLVIFIALSITTLVLGFPDQATHDYANTRGYVYLGAVLSFFLLQIALVASRAGGAKSSHRHHDRR